MSQSRLNDLAVLNINADITKVWISVIFKGFLPINKLL